MAVSTEHTAQLIERFLAGQLDSNEVDAFFDLVQSNDIRSALENSVDNSIEQFSFGDQVSETDKQRLLLAIEERGNIIPSTPIKAAYRIHFLKRGWLRCAAAAILIIFMSTVAYLWKTQQEHSILVATNPIPTQNDVAAPQSVNAVITLASGKQIVLDSALNGTLATDGNVRLVKLAEGKVAYSGKSTIVEFNTLTNPRGSRTVNLTLADGSQVWLNAESSIHYPISFIGKERKVEITGEAYFEVAKNPTKKFIVSNNQMSVEVLGTHFNMNTYEGERVRQVTLLEGSILVNQSGKKVIIKPGDQAVIRKGSIEINKSIDIEKVMAWKNGLFDFNNKTLEESLRQIGRWYDVNIIYETKQPSIKLAGTIGRSLTLLQLLKGLSAMELKTRLDASGKKLIILE